MHSISCERSFGAWAIRVNGIFIASYWWEANARRAAMNLHDALNQRTS